MITAAIAIGGLGLLAGLGLGVASKVFAVYVDPKVLEVEEALPGANCGGCGYPGCSAAAVAIVSGKAPANCCVGGGPEVQRKVSAIMGVALEEKEPEIARVKCTGTVDKSDRKMLYSGVETCAAAVMVAGGDRVCDIGCVGFGTCEENCPFDAIKLGREGIPVVDPARCTGCGTCVRGCPKQVLELVSPTSRILQFNRSDECQAPCTQACPAQIDIPRYIALIAEGRYEEAVGVIKERNPFPLSIGRVCPHPCESVCRRNKVDEPVNINHLKRFAADYEWTTGRRIEVPVAASTGKRIAVVGGGPGGLTAAYYLTRLGHKAVVFEAMPELGGMLRYGIPEYRLPKKILDWEIEGILELGIETHCNRKLGEDFRVSGLLEEGFDAVYLSTGAWASRRLGLEEEDELKGVLSGTEFLAKRGLGEPVEIGRRVAVVGGGNTAIDAARTCWRLGAEEVTVVYRRSRHEMPANEIEIEEAEKEGIRFLFLCAPKRLIGREGRLKSLEVIRMELAEPDASGRRRPVPVEGSETSIEVDTVISAIGQFPDLTFLNGEKYDTELVVTRWRTLEVQEDTMQTNVPQIFAGGDAVSGPATVVQAIGAGRKAARSIHLYVTGEPVTPPPHMRKELFDAANEIELRALVPREPRARMPELPVEERRLNFKEVELGLSEEEALREAGRCLQCGLYCFRRTLAEIRK